MNAPLSFDSDPAFALRCWLEERALDLVLEEGGRPQFGPGESDFVFGTDPQVGDLRLLPDGGTSDRPCYVLVLPGEGRHREIVPFSPYAVPACEDEWYIRDEPPLRVLQMWNARHLPAGAIRMSWTLSHFDVDTLHHLHEQRLELAHHYAVGAPLSHPLDPRWAYRDECWEWFSRCLGGPARERAFPGKGYPPIAAEARRPWGNAGPRGEGTPPA